MDIGKDLQEAYEQGRRDALNEIMEYTYGMLTAEKFGLQHKIKSMMSTTDTLQTETKTETQNSNENSNVILVYDGVSEAVRCAMCSNPNKSDRGCDGACSYDEKLYERIMKAIAESVAEDEPQTDGILFKGNLKEGDYKLIKTTNGWVLEGNDIAYCGEPQTEGVSRWQDGNLLQRT